MSVQTFETMGTVASLHASAPLDRADFAAVEAVFRRFDQTYSLYDDASELSRLARGEISLAKSSADIRDTYGRALDWREKTAGLFTPHRPDGVIDLSGIVKALAITDAGALLRHIDAGWLLTVGGDVLGRRPSRQPGWGVGIVDPADRTGIVGVAPVGGMRPALATSGIAERGDHIWSRNGRSHFAQATVAAADIVTADVLATAIMAGTATDLDDITATWDVDVLTIDRAGRFRATPGARAWLEPAVSTAR